MTNENALQCHSQVSTCKEGMQIIIVLLLLNRFSPEFREETLTSGELDLAISKDCRTQISHDLPFEFDCILS